MLKEKMSNEALVATYRDTRDERYLEALMEQNKGLMYMLVDPFVKSIPKAEYEDLTQEAYIAMVKAVEDFDPTRGLTFSNLLKVYVRQDLSRIYNSETRQKRYSGSSDDSYERLAEINREGGSEGSTYFSIECEDFKAVEFRELLASLDLNEKEAVAVKVLMGGGTKGEVAERLGVTPATANYYFKQIRKKFVLAGVSI